MYEQVTDPPRPVPAPAAAPEVTPPAATAAATTAAATTGPLVGQSGKTHSPKYMWGILGIGIGSQAAFSSVFQGIPTAGSELQSAYHLTASQLGIILAAVTCGVFITDVFWGILSDRIGERKVLITGMTGMMITLAAITVFLTPSHGTLPTYQVLAAVLFLVGALGGCVNGASGRAVMGWFPLHKRGFAISLRVAAVPAGGAIGAAVIPALAMSGGFRWVFGFLTGFTLLATIAVVLWLDEPPLAKTKGKGKGKDGAGQPEFTLPNPLKRWDIWRIGITAFLLDLPQFTVLTFGSVFLHTVKHIPLATIAVLLVIVQVLSAVSRVWGGRWTDRHGGRYRRTLVTVYSWAIAAGFGGIALFESAPAWVIATLLTVSGILACGWHGVHYAEIATMAGAERSGTALGLENTLVFGGAFVTPLLIPLVLSASSWPMVMLLIGAVPAVASALLMPREPKVS
ncbi:MFS transporter [Streptacidiphilus sp. P02-A3a]|uniref:MFS transporter n=1 Tax=Streptacidiphilus sp. P02-A3a TaxID=2704468 RepID=UPI0015FC973E|nr:MFS transporter [Streptacidiphilus sp. P02-A3a]QMU68228.1 MFS transporter [Streptacidiphilus sp. P02-A3a]